MDERSGKAIIQAIVDSYSSPVVRAYCSARFLILRQRFYEEISQYIRPDARVLELGCGFGLFSLYVALSEPGRVEAGQDLDARRIQLARRAARRLGAGNARFDVGDALAYRAGRERYDAVVLIDLVHHLPRDRARAVLGQCRDSLGPDGLMLVKEVETGNTFKTGFTYVADRAVAGLDCPIHYRSRGEMRALLTDLGFRVRHHSMIDYIPFPHIFYVATRR